MLAGRGHEGGIGVGVVRGRAGAAATSVLATGLLVQVLGVALPGHVGGGELIEQRWYVAGVGAAVRSPGGVRLRRLLGVGGRRRLPVVRVLLPRTTLRDDSAVTGEVVVLDTAVGLGVLFRCLTGHQRQVVVHARVTGAVVV